MNLTLRSVADSVGGNTGGGGGGGEDGSWENIPEKLQRGYPEKTKEVSGGNTRCYREKIKPARHWES